MPMLFEMWQCVNSFLLQAQYYPSYLLCPEVFSWHPVEECSPKLDKNKYSRFADPDKGMGCHEDV